MTPVAPWQIWWANLDPAVAHEQAGTRPVLVVSSAFHLRLTRGTVVTVIPLTTRERPYLMHRVRIDIPSKRVSYAITEQQRTVAADRLVGNDPMYELTPNQVSDVGNVLRRMTDM